MEESDRIWKLIGRYSDARWRRATVAPENLCEFDVPLTTELLRDIHILCDMMHLTPAALPYLETLVVDV
jgi:hypothetical protein